MSLLTRAKQLFHGTMADWGLQVSRLPPTPLEQDALARLFEQRGIDVILDVGANVGQYAKGVLERGYTGRIVSFEPLSKPRASLLRESEKHPGWEVGERTCLGDREERAIEIQISENSIASSILPATDEHLRLSPTARYVGSETVPMVTLDAISPAYLKLARAPFLKIDVQGYEEQVLAGAVETIPQLVGLQVELSIVPLYEGQMCFSDMLKHIEGMGLELYLLWSAYSERRTGRLLQADAVFFRPPIGE